MMDSINTIMLDKVINNFEKQIEQKVLQEITNAFKIQNDKINCTSTINKPFTTDDLEKLIKTMNELPPVCIELQIKPLAYVVLDRNINTIKSDNFKKEEVHNGYISPFKGMKIVVVDKDEELQDNQGRAIYSDGSEKIIDIFE